MARAVSWKQLRIGLLTFVGIVAVVGAVLRYAQIGALHGDTTRIYMVTDVAAGVLSGTDVWLGGEKVGLVRSVSLRPPSSDTSERVLITMDILSGYMRYIRRNSDVQIQPSGTLIGSPVVSITPGTPAAAELGPRDTLRALAELESKPHVADISSLSDSADAIGAELGEIMRDMGSTEGEVNDLRQRSERQIGDVRNAVTRFAERSTASRGSIALVIHDTLKVRLEINRLSALADSIVATASSPRGNVGRFRRDSTLVRNAHQVMASADTLRGELARYRGGMSGRDSALAMQLQRVHVQLDSLVQDAKRHPLRYIAL